METYTIKINKNALKDIQAATDWYNIQSSGLGTRFQNKVKVHINSLKSSPLLYRVRYSDVCCLLIDKFPFLIHYTVNESINLVEIFAVIHTSRNPKIWEIKRKLK